MGKASKLKKLKKALAPLQGQADGIITNIQRPGDAPEEYRKADQEYFAKHPTETVYVRPAFPGEFPELPNVKKVEVRLVGEGARTRRPLA